METININEVEYSVEDLSDEVKVLINRVIELEQGASQLRRQVTEAQVVIENYTQQIITAVEEKSDED